MIETIVKVDGMMCGMCESHVNEQTVIHSEQPLDEQKLRDAINATGYEVKGVKSAPYEKKGFFSFLKK